MDPLKASLLGLPRELRDQIYDHTIIYQRVVRVSENIETSRYDGHRRLRVTARDTPNFSLYRVCHQIKDEYFSYVRNKGALIVVQRRHSGLYKKPLPKAFSYIRFVELHLATSLRFTHERCRLGEFYLFKNWVNDLAQNLPDLQHLEVCLYSDVVVQDNPTNATQLQGYCQAIFQLPHVTKLTAYFTQYDMNEQWSFALDRTKVFETSFQGRIQQPDDNSAVFLADSGIYGLKDRIDLKHDDDEDLGFEWDILKWLLF